ncbi:MAG: DMT family transporter [Thermomicrobia bacterium]|nr:DMT family transporter [Thermomicrobia bacterium]
MGLGELLGLTAAVIWATSNTLMRMQTARLGAVAVNFWRCLVGVPFFIILFLIVRDPASLRELAPLTILYIVLGVCIGMVTGDTLQYHAIKLIGVSRAMPISGCFPLFTVFFAWLLNGEPIRVRVIGGAVVVMMGVLLISLPKRSPARLGIIAAPAPVAVDRANMVGIVFSLIAAVCWSLSTVVQSKALAHSDPITVNLIRMPVAAGVLLVASRGRANIPLRQFGARTFLFLVFIGIFGTGLASITYLGALKIAGAGKTAVLGATAPLFALPLSMLLLGERPGLRAVLGTLLTVLGIALVVLS